ncbi:MAG: shikimate dehydrogenase, partial [Bergeyella zoohelcum]|nr:shikimate dehydrogenase [Bergeyella zoohelcum]
MKHKTFGLVGKNISYSFSQKYFTEKFKKLFLQNHSYQVFDIENIEQISSVFDTENLVGFNV